MVLPDYWWSYKSHRFIEVRNKKLAFIFWSLQLAILAYVVIYSILLKKAYQEYDELVGTTSVKVKGSAYTGTMDSPLVFDSNDLTFPVPEVDASFVATNIVETSLQKRGICEGNNPENERCDNGCEEGKVTWNGVMTGKCGPSGEYCELHAWCPLEEVNPHPSVYPQVRNWTLFVKVDAAFPRFEVNINNFEKGLERGYNLFTYDDILLAANTTFEDVASKGAIILASLDYDCILNRHHKAACDVDITYRRIDGNVFSKGFNYRYILRTPFAETRSLYKVMGIRILYHVSGRCGRFDFVQLMIALGAGAGILSASKFICDFLLEYCLDEGEKYMRYKYRADYSQHSDEESPLLRDKERAIKEEKNEER